MLWIAGVAMFCGLCTLAAERLRPLEWEDDDVEYNGPFDDVPDQRG
jgi:hypothetical protein